MTLEMDKNKYITSLVIKFIKLLSKKLKLTDNGFWKTAKFLKIFPHVDLIFSELKFDFSKKFVNISMKDIKDFTII